MVLDKVAEILAETAAEVIEPRFRALATGEVVEKAPGDLVTVADREAELIIAERLRGLLPVPVVGEEAVSADPALVEAVRTEPAVWLVDPLDGTGNFVAGKGDYAVMAALIRDGETVAGWIWQPVSGNGYAAERGGGAWLNGERLRRVPAAGGPATWRGAVLSRFLEPGMRSTVEAGGRAFGTVTPGSRAAGVEYPRIATGEQEFTLFWRTLPWDHAPGSLLVTEAGGVSARLDGVPYQPGRQVDGLLVAADEECWHQVREQLLGPIR
ncbi:inositol monophosphatase family protein [Peterkaempfera bronchialis]|uniref:Inositol monophosphatase n=1 Tax=Peterkaempfera bronchialis TaxID=2126346 RepID=A0A345T3F6_9ACTN|nr:inositol monophosphatase family protein [Peterkaempfera bronchialis]AXI80511.1 inositol monophosphatase [Peterkaempfera bronchialis]